MDRDPATTELDLHGAATVTPAGVSRAPLPIRAGRVGTGTSTRAHRLNLDGQLVFPRLVNAHDHLHVNAVPPIRLAGQFRTSYEWIDAFKAHFATPAVDDALAVPLDVRLRQVPPQNLLAAPPCLAT